MLFLGGKAVFFTLAFAVPMPHYPMWAIRAVYSAASFVQGVVLAVVFQLAYCFDLIRALPVFGWNRESQR